jgi:hypothetical protein
MELLLFFFFLYTFFLKDIFFVFSFYFRRLSQALSAYGRGPQIHFFDRRATQLKVVLTSKFFRCVFFSF